MRKFIKRLVRIEARHHCLIPSESAKTCDSFCCQKYLCVTFAESNKGISKLYQNNPCVPRTRRCKCTTSTICPVCYIRYAWYVVHRPIKCCDTEKLNSEIGVFDVFAVFFSVLSAFSNTSEYIADTAEMYATTPTNTPKTANTSLFKFTSEMKNPLELSRRAFDNSGGYLFLCLRK